MFEPKPRPKRVDIELMQVESQIRQQRARLDYARLTESQKTTLQAAIDGAEKRAEHLRDLIAWEKELETTA